MVLLEEMIETQLAGILQSRGISREVKTIVITCVDPNYSTESLGLPGVGLVQYDHNHVQQADPARFIQLFLAYNAMARRLESIAKEQVHESLPRGILQIASSKDTLVLGIPGDSYAFSTGGTGFAFGMPNHAPAIVAQDVLKGIVSYSTQKVGKKKVSAVVMMHPDCGLFANNVGRHDDAHIRAAQDLVNKKCVYTETEYCRLETEAKAKGAADAIRLINKLLPGAVVQIARPPYVNNRVPGVVNALAGQAH